MASFSVEVTDHGSRLDVHIFPPVDELEDKFYTVEADGTGWVVDLPDGAMGVDDMSGAVGLCIADFLGEDV